MQCILYMNVVCWLSRCCHRSRHRHLDIFPYFSYTAIIFVCDVYPLSIVDSMQSGPRSLDHRRHPYNDYRIVLTQRQSVCTDVRVYTSSYLNCGESERTRKKSSSSSSSSTLFDVCGFARHANRMNVRSTLTNWSMPSLATSTVIRLKQHTALQYFTGQTHENG